MPKSAATTELVRKHFRKAAFSFDHLYDEEHIVQRWLRPGLFARRELAVSVVQSYSNPRVIDVGCGSGRVGEFALDAGAAEYVGVDFAEEMLDLAQERLSRFGPRVELVHADFLEAPLDGKFDVIIGLGLFDYLPQPDLFARRMYELCSGSVVASFPKWNWFKGPIRKIRYEWINDCPIFNYTERELRLMFGSAGFSRVEIIRGRSGLLMRADV